MIINKLFNQLSSDIIWITNPQQLKAYESELQLFFQLYEHPSNFPDPDELEEPKYIKQRIKDASRLPHTHLMMCFVTDVNETRSLAGGCIVEFYPDSACGLVTYLFVERAWRGLKVGAQQTKVAEILLQGDHGLPALVEFFRSQYKKKVNAVFFESNNPEFTDADHDSMPPAKRIMFFDRLGAKRVKFNYRQPPLGDSKGVVDNLFLMIFPQLTQLGTQLPMQTVILFIAELARSLDQNKSLDAPDVYGEQNYRNDQQILRTINRIPFGDWHKVELKGFVVNGKNIINETFHDLLINASNGQIYLVSALNK